MKKALMTGTVDPEAAEKKDGICVSSSIRKDGSLRVWGQPEV